MKGGLITRTYKKPDYVLKSKVLREHSDLIQKEKEISYLKYALNDYEQNGVIRAKLDFDILDQETTYICDLVENNLMLYYHEAKKINQATYKRIKRLKDRIANLLTKPCSFITFTFTNETMIDTNEATRRTYITRFLKSLGYPYIANIDYGKNTEREHYHAIVQIQDITLNEWNDKYGFTWIERIHGGKANIHLAKYISKLTNHAIKETTKRKALIYSR